VLNVLINFSDLNNAKEKQRKGVLKEGLNELNDKLYDKLE
jgi:hypothetical protein